MIFTNGGLQFLNIQLVGRCIRNSWFSFLNAVFIKLNINLCKKYVCMCR